MAAPAEETPAPTPAPTLWEQICAEFEAEQPIHPDQLVGKQEPVQEEKQEPASTDQVPVDAGTLPLSRDQSKLIIDASFPLTTPSVLSLPSAPLLPDLKTCSPSDFVEHYVFPVLLPGLAEMFLQAKKEKCFERKRTKFIALDFLTEWLYNQNSKRKDEPFTEFFEIPFVKDWLKDQKNAFSDTSCSRVAVQSPRPPIALSLLLSEEEAGNIIQSFWRGYRVLTSITGNAQRFQAAFLRVVSDEERIVESELHPAKVRCEPEVQELRQWQKHLKETKNIMIRIREFWAKQEKKVGVKMEDSGQPTPERSRISVVENLQKTEVTAETKEDQTVNLLAPSP